MRKLSETFAVQNIIGIKAPSIDNRENYAWQSLVLFDNVLDTDKILHSPEIIHLAEYFYGKAFISIVNTEYAEALQEWVRDEMYKADAGNKAMIYPIKSKFEDLTVDSPGEDYSGPLNITIIESEGFERDLLIITCKWGDGVFRNDYYVLGILADTEDLERLIEEQIRK